MAKVSRKGKGKTMYIRMSVFPCGKADPTKILTISCPDEETRFKTTLSDDGLKKFRDHVLQYYKALVLDKA